jgi:hypothetical protein
VAPAGALAKGGCSASVFGTSAALLDTATKERPDGFADILVSCFTNLNIFMNTWP